MAIEQPTTHRTVTEVHPGGPAEGVAPRLVHPRWAETHPWLVQGVTTRGAAAEAFDLGLFGGVVGRDVQPRWVALRAAEEMQTAVHAFQVHGAVVRHHRELPPGLHLAEPCDGHVTRTPDVLLTVSVADCVPVTLVEPRVRAVALLHAGWRGAAAGVVEAGLAALARRLDVAAGSLEAHLGPSICGSCYEVGPEVFEALGEEAPPGPTPIDLRAVLVRRLVRAGVDADRITTSTWCTRCGDSPFFSHRGGHGGRQMAYAGVRR